MKLREIIVFIDRRKGLQRYLIGVSIFLVLVLLVLVKDCGEPYVVSSDDEQQDEKMREIANECKSAAMEYDFITSHKLLTQLNTDALSSTDYYVKERKRKRYEEAFDFVFNTEAMYLCSKGDRESMDRLVFLLASIPEKGIQIPEGTEYYQEPNFDHNVREEHQDYINYATKYNQKCDALIDLAITNKNFLLVERVIPLFKPIAEPLEDLEEGHDGKFKKHVVRYNQSMKKHAITKVNKAIRDGIFPSVNNEIK